MADARGAGGTPLHLPLPGSIPARLAGPEGFESAIKTRRRQSLPSGQEGGRGAAAGPPAVLAHAGRRGGDREGRPAPCPQHSRKSH